MRKTETDKGPPPMPTPEEQTRAKEREKEDRILAKIRHEATLYATCFDQVSQRLAPWMQARNATTGVLIKDGLSWTDVKDAATSLFIQVERTIESASFWATPR